VHLQSNRWLARFGPHRHLDVIASAAPLNGLAIAIPVVPGTVHLYLVSEEVEELDRLLVVRRHARIVEVRYL
jgi:hypothetical protein